jgi:hypothetical protein
MISLFFSATLASVVAALNAAADGFFGFFAVIQEAHESAARFETLSRLSDAELARRGLKREGLAQVVFAPGVEA